VKPIFFLSASEFRAWLDARGEREKEVVVGFYKKRSGRAGLTYQDALDEALARGWIDGVRRGLDDERWTIRFTPRKPRSIWSNVNVRRVKELIALGRMKPAGLRAFEARDPERSGIYGHEREQMTFDPALAKKLRANRSAASFFEAQPPGYRRILTYWVMSAKKDDARLRRLAALELRKEARRVEIDQPLLHFRDRQDVAIAHDQIDVIERDTFGLQAIIDHLLVEAARMLDTRDPLLGDRECDGAVAQQAGAHIMVIGVQAEDIGVFGHGYSFKAGIVVRGEIEIVSSCSRGL